jgi:hypothetical protein
MDTQEEKFVVVAEKGNFHHFTIHNSSVHRSFVCFLPSSLPETDLHIFDLTRIIIYYYYYLLFTLIILTNLIA